VLQSKVRAGVACPLVLRRATILACLRVFGAVRHSPRALAPLPHYLHDTMLSLNMRVCACAPVRVPVCASVWPVARLCRTDVEAVHDLSIKLDGEDADTESEFNVPDDDEPNSLDAGT
jgi:hypothetical protein